MKPLSILTWLWKGQTMGRDRVTYVSDHVNRLYSMVQRHLTLPHRFICVTDQPEGIRSEVEIVPMWTDLAGHGRCFRRLKVFDPSMAKVLGPRIVSIDLDTVIVQNIDSLFDRPEPFVIWGDRSPADIAAGTPYCGSLFMLTAGYRPDVFTSFDPVEAATLRTRFGYIGSDQAWMSHKIKGAPVWTKADGIYSFRLDIQMSVLGQGGPGIIYARKPRGPAPRRRDGSLPERCKVCFFHGAEDPSQTHLHIHHKWIEANWK